MSDKKIIYTVGSPMKALYNVKRNRESYRAAVVQFFGGDSGDSVLESQSSEDKKIINGKGVYDEQCRIFPSEFKEFLKRLHIRNGSIPDPVNYLLLLSGYSIEEYSAHSTRDFWRTCCGRRGGGNIIKANLDMISRYVFRANETDNSIIIADCSVREKLEEGLR